ncbi:MAG: hypothetical protein GVY13_07235 [Alphaproteobacteria bacterium]|jgi:hypothetical protein|nr:hypothetical protein [Alphaproteobacteria bacterium]
MFNARTLLSATAAAALLMGAHAGFAAEEELPTEGPVTSPGVNEPGLNEPAAEEAGMEEGMGYEEDMVPEGVTDVEEQRSEALDETPAPGINEPGLNEPAEQEAEDVR